MLNRKTPPGVTLFWEVHAHQGPPGRWAPGAVWAGYTNGGPLEPYEVSRGPMGPRGGPQPPLVFVGASQPRGRPHPSEAP